MSFGEPDPVSIAIEGWNGDWFDVAGPDQWKQGVCLASESEGTEFDGMYEAPLTVLFHSTAFQIGATPGLSREDMYEFVLAFFVIGTPGIPWRVTNSRLRKAFSSEVGQLSKIHYTTTDSTRRLEVMLTGKVRIKSGYDPNGEQMALVLVPLAAPFPRWIEDDVTDVYTTTTDTTVSGTENGTIKISNPCNVDIWLKWVLQAGAAGIKITLPDFSWGNDEFERGVADAARKIVMPALISGEHVVVDTDEFAENGQVNSSLDTEVYLRMNGVEFMYKIPAGLGGETPVSVPVSFQKAPIGTGVQVRCPRQWTRPEGLE